MRNYIVSGLVAVVGFVLILALSGCSPTNEQYANKAKCSHLWAGAPVWYDGERPGVVDYTNDLRGHAYVRFEGQRFAAVAACSRLSTTHNHGGVE